MVLLERAASVDEVKAAFRAAADGPLAGIIEYSEEAIVSSDIIGNTHSVIFDAPFTMANGNVVKVFGWYDNEYGYSARLVDLVGRLG